MFVNGVNCDIYIGTGAGKKLLEEIKSAAYSVKIVSPYLSASLVEDLIGLKNRGIAVELITENTIEDFQDNRNIKKLIKQQREVDEVAVAKRDKTARTTVIFLVLALSTLALFLVSVFRIQAPIVYLGIVPVISFFLIYLHYRSAVRNKVIYHYRYTALFPFRVFVHHSNNRLDDTARGNTTFVHSKMYLIDDRIAYLGSLNFTVSGTRENYETRIRTEDPVAVEAISQEYTRLMSVAEYAHKDIQAWGKEVYSEPIN